MDNDGFAAEHSPAEQHPHVDNQQCENSTQNQSSSGRNVRMIDQVKTSSRRSKVLTYSCWSAHPVAACAGVFALFTCLAMIISVLVVCLTSPKAKNPSCKIMLSPTVQYSSHDTSHPQSVAVGDFNNDSQMDIVVANSGIDNVGVFLGHGNNIFASQITYSSGVGSAPHMVTVADFNNDNRSDIAVANFGTNNIGILLGNGDGSFKSQKTIETTPSRPLSVATGDFNNDEQLDIVFTSYGTNSIDVLLGLGNGNFTIQTTFSTGYDSFPYSVAVGDFNNDNKLDIAVTNYGTDNVGVLLGYGNGTFVIQTTYTTGVNSHPYSIAIHDLNNDTKLDIAVVNSGTYNLGVLFGYGNGSFTLPTFHSTGNKSNPIFVVIADFNNDNNPDITIANNGTDSVGVLLGYGNGIFANQITYSTGSSSSPHSIAVADFNNDNRLDIAIVNQQNNNVMIFNGFSNETFASEIPYPTVNRSSSVNRFFYTTGVNSYPFSVAVGDFNHDGRLDITVGNLNTNNVGVLLGYGNGTFASQTTYSTGNHSGPNSVAVGDLNKDGRLDIVVANSGTDNVGILFGNGDGTFQNQRTFSTGQESGPSSVALGDFDNDDYLDIAVANFAADNVGVLNGYGFWFFVDQMTYSTGEDSRPQSVAVGDFNNDGYLDITVAQSGYDMIGVLLGYGGGYFGSQTSYSADYGSYVRSVAVGDFNNDSNLDIAFGNFGTNNVGVLLGYGDGTFASQMTYSTGAHSGPKSVAVSDINNDGWLDIAVVNYFAKNIGVLLGYGNGTFASQAIYKTGLSSGSVTTSLSSGPTSIAIGDFNNDNRLDITVTNPATDNVGVLLGYGDGIFPCIIDVSRNGSYPTSVAIGDVNNDRRLDIVVANSGTGNVGILLGYGNGTFASQATFPTGCGSDPRSVVIADFNGDGRLDIAVANFGTNNVGVLLGHGNGTFASQMTSSTGSTSSPVSVAVGDFNNDSRPDIVVANFEWNYVGVLLGYGDGTFAKQGVYYTGDYSNPISVATGDFNNDGQLDIAVANYFAYNVGVLLGVGNGLFYRQKTFAVSVYSYPVALAVGDFNNDSNLDIAVVNSADFQEIVFILLGNGNAVFSGNGKYKTGIQSKPSSIVIGDFNNDSRLDIAVTNNGTNNLGIFLGYGDGTFSSQTIYSTNDGSNPISIAVGDFNGDHLTDVAVANNGTCTVDIFLAFMKTNFEERATLTTGSAASPRAIAFGDFTKDGNLNLAVANYGTQNIGLLSRYANGTFSMQTAYSTDFTFYPVSIAVTDFNNDTQLDIAVTNPVVDQISVFFGEKNGTFGNHTAYSTGIGSNPQSVAIGDFNNDYQADIVVAHSSTGSIGVLLKGDTGAFKSLRTFSTGSGSKPHGLAVGDFDNDGRLDITVANNGNANIGFFFGFGNGTFSNQSTTSIDGIFPVWVAVGDFNNDKQLDVVVVDNIPPSPIIVLLGNGNGSFQIKMQNQGSRAGSGAVGDFNNDSRLDLVLGQPYDDTLSVLLGYGDGTFGYETTYSTGNGSYPQSITVADFNNDNRLDIAVACPRKDNVGILLGHGDGKFSIPLLYSTGSGSYPGSIGVADFNNDSKLDIAVANFFTNNIGIRFGYGDGNFSSQMIYPTGDGSAPESVIVGDFNNDGQLDIAVTNYGSGNVGILLGHFNGTFFNVITYATGDNSQLMSMAAVDFNNDGRLDITFSDIGTESIGVFLGYASESFISTAAYSIGYSSQPESIAVGDFDNDTRLDVTVADRGTNKIVILRGSGYGTFSSQWNYSTGDGSYPSWVAIGDFNQDDRLDIVAVNSGTNTIGVLLGYGNGMFSSQKTYSTGDFSSPLSLAVGYFDNDTQLDIAVANFGTSNVALLFGYGNGSFASALFFTTGFGAHPIAVAFGDFNKDNSTDIAVANNGYSTIQILSKIC